MNEISQNDYYLSIKEPVHHEVKVKGSRFIGLASPVASKEIAESVISSVRKKYYDATHHCYAYQVGLEDEIHFRYNDDGEPSGTAGKPIFDALSGRNLTDILCIVTRYFGGTKLGTGGLARAYGQCASETLDQAKVIRHLITKRMTLRFDFDRMGSVMTLLSKYQCKTIQTCYQPGPEIEIAVCQSQLAGLCEALVNETAGCIEITSKET